MMPLTAAIVLANRTVWEQAHACLQNLPVRLAVEQGMEQSNLEETDALLDRIERHRVDVVLVEASRISMPLEEFVRRLRNTASQPAVFVLNSEASPELILEALRAGANEYLYPPLADSLTDALQRLSAARSKGGSDTSNALGKLFGFLSVRGGCGATTFAIHAATEIARQVGTGPRAQSILLADFDFEAGLLRFLMKLKTNYSVQDAIGNLRRMDSSLWQGLVSTHPDKLHLIPAPEEIAAKKPPEREETMHLMRFIRSTYPLSILDFGRVSSAVALNALPELEHLYLVTTPDHTSVVRARRALRSVEDRGFAPNRIKVLLNRAGKMDLGAIQKTLGRPCDGLFRNDHLALYDAYSEGKLLPPANPLGKELHALADSIRVSTFGDRTPDARKAPAQASAKRWLSFFQKSGVDKMQGQGVQA